MRKPSLLPIAVALLLACSIAATAFGVYDASRATRGERQDACRLARWAIRRASAGKPRRPLPFVPKGLLSRSAPCFVTLSYQNRRHGCTGDFDAHGRRLAENIVEVAVRAWRLDPRSKPLTPTQLKEARIYVTIPGERKTVSDPSPYPPANYGLVVRSGHKAAVLLPGEAKTGRWQVAEARRQAGLPPDARVEFQVFRAVTWEETINRKPPTKNP